MDNIRDTVNSIILDPQYADYLALIKAARNGAVYGAKVRFPHALVMVFLFRSGPLREKLALIFKATRTHARNLAKFAVAYKSTMILLRRASPSGKEESFHTFLAGLTGGYLVFGRGIQSSVNQQIVIYVFARVALALAKLSIQKRTEGGVGLGWEMREKVQRNAWPVFASLSWAMVMWLFRWYPDTIQPSLRSSMKYIPATLSATTGRCISNCSTQQYQPKRLRAWDPVRDCAYNIYGHREIPPSTAGMEATDCTPAVSTLGLGLTAMADDPTAANTISDSDMQLFTSEDQWFHEYTRSINDIPQIDTAPPNLVESEGGPDTVSPSTLTAQTLVPASLPMAANNLNFQPGSTSTLLAQSVTFADTSNSRTFGAQTPTIALTVDSRVSQPYTPQPHGSHGPTRTTLGHSRSQPFAIPTSMQHPAHPHGQQFPESQLSVPGSLQMQQPGHGQLYGPSPQETMLPAYFNHKRAYPGFNGPSNEQPQMEYMPSNNPYQASNMMQGPNVNGVQNYPQFNSHMNGFDPTQPMAYGSQPQTFLEPQDYSNMPNLMSGQTYPHQVGEQQQQQQQPPQNHVNMSNQMPGQTYQHRVGEYQQQQQQQQAPQNHVNMSDQMSGQTYPQQVGECQQQQQQPPQNHVNMSDQMPGQTYPQQVGGCQQQQQPPQNHLNMSNQMPGQTYPHQVGEHQQQVALRQPQQPAQPGFEWIPGLPLDVKEMMMRVLLQHIVNYRTRFKEILKIEFPASFAKCMYIRFKADYVIKFSMACKLCHSQNIAAGSQTRKYQLTDKMEKRENLKMIVEWGTELWHFCQNCRAQWNVFSPVHCRYWGEYLAEDLGQGPNSNAPYHHERKELLSQSAVHLEQAIQKPAQSAGQPQQPVQESTELQITGYFPSQEPSQESAQVTTPGLARGQSNGGISHHGSSLQDTVQGPHQGLDTLLPSRLNQPPGPYQEHSQQQTREQAISRNPAPTPSALRNGTWRPKGQQQGEEADKDTSEGTTQVQGTCRDSGVLNGQKSAAKGPQSKAIGSGQATTQNAIKESTSHTAPTVEPSDSRPMKRHRKL